jgi:outer membrane protein assembly factor BamB
MRLLFCLCPDRFHLGSSLVTFCIGWQLLFFSEGARALDQPQWGEAWTRNMVSSVKNLPSTFDLTSGRNVKWSVPLGGETHGTPIVSQGRIFIGTNNDDPRDPRHQGDRGVLLCLNETDGQFVWQSVVPKREGDIFLDWPRSGMCSTPTVEGNRVYMLNNRGEVMCLDLQGMANGNDGPFVGEKAHMALRGAAPMEFAVSDADVIWLFDLVGGAGIYSHDSAHASILIHGPFLYLNTGNGVDNTHKRIRAPEAPSLVVLDKATGRFVAQDKEGIGPRIFHATWSSPALAKVKEQTRVFLGGGDGVLYAFEALATNSIPAGDPIASLQKVWQFDCDPTAPKQDVHRFNGNRRESPSNIKSIPVFHQNRLYVTVGGDLWWGKHQAWLKCIDASGSGDVTRNGEIWSYALDQHCMATPAVEAGLVYVGDCGRKIHCVDAQTGRSIWTHETKGEIWASPLVADGKVFFATKRGELFVFTASREKRLLHEAQMGSPISATPVAANGVLYIATMNRLFALQVP